MQSARQSIFRWPFSSLQPGIDVQLALQCECFSAARCIAGCSTMHEGSSSQLVCMLNGWLAVWTGKKSATGEANQGRDAGAAASGVGQPQALEAVRSSLLLTCGEHMQICCDTRALGCTSSCTPAALMHLLRNLLADAVHDAGSVAHLWLILGPGSLA